MSNFLLQFDGSCGPKNPGGTAGYGFILTQDERSVDSGHGVIGTGPGMTNNLAEFHALFRGLTAFNAAVSGTPGKHTLLVRGDSNLVINVMNKNWRAKSGKAYYIEYEAAQAMLNLIRRAGHTVMLEWVPRERNTGCDDLSKAHLAE